ncbi:MAG: alpha/beta hydrolase, partial [Erysipelotrichaceae bacterium]|nr:alpha/beta hydrolase [Erysipelotrichaceae bacterium]
LNGYYNMFKGISRLYDKDLLNNVPKDLPLFFVSGHEDPVGTNGKEVEHSVQTLKDAGVRNIDLKLYPGDRHEILNELDKDVVYDDLYNWMNDKMK